MFFSSVPSHTLHSFAKKLDRQAEKTRVGRVRLIVSLSPFSSDDLFVCGKYSKEPSRPPPFFLSSIAPPPFSLPPKSAPTRQTQREKQMKEKSVIFSPCLALPHCSFSPFPPSRHILLRVKARKEREASRPTDRPSTTPFLFPLDRPPPVCRWMYFVCVCLSGEGREHADRVTALKSE